MVWQDNIIHPVQSVRTHLLHDGFVALRIAGTLMRDLLRLVAVSMVVFQRDLEECMLVHGRCMLLTHCGISRGTGVMGCLLCYLAAAAPPGRPSPGVPFRSIRWCIFL